MKRVIVLIKSCKYVIFLLTLKLIKLIERSEVINEFVMYT